MRICLIGKFPPIQGGVSMRTYWAAHALAARGHEVHVVTNANEVRPPLRMHMREQDWRRCEAIYGQGSVAVHWTDPVDRSQAYIPMASPFVSKLAGIALRLNAERPFDVIHSFYLEPYGVAGHLVAQMAGIPHVTRTAGSDAGRLWRHPQLEALYDQVLRSAAGVIAGNAVAALAIQRGVDACRIAFAGGVVVPEDVFTPAGPRLDLAALRDEVAADPDVADLSWGEFTGGRPYFGVYGKLGESKGSFALLAAMRRLKSAGLDVGLVALAHGPPAVEERFRAQAQDFGLADRILQLPFLPHWRVPEFIRGCLAVCCLEQDFPIRFHSPIMPREVLLCGTCLLAATEVIRKLPGYGRLPHGFGCVAVDDVSDVDALSRRLAAIAEDPAPAADVGARGREFACLMQRNVPFPQELERALVAAAAGRIVRREAARWSGTDGPAGHSPSPVGQIPRTEGASPGPSDEFAIAEKAPCPIPPEPSSNDPASGAREHSEGGAPATALLQSGGEKGGSATCHDPGLRRDGQSESRFWLCQLAAAAVERADRDAGTAVRQPVASAADPDPVWARALLAAIEERVADGREALRRLIPAVQVEIAIAAAERDADSASIEEEGDPLFRLRIARWGLANDDLAGLACVRARRLGVLTFDFDVTELMSVRTADDLVAPPVPRRSFMVVFGRSGGADGGRRGPLAVDRATAKILELSDGTRSAAEIVEELNRDGELAGAGIGLKCIEYLFVYGLISLTDRRLGGARDHCSTGRGRHAEYPV